ncbi:cupin domain-containing protein [sulfur-oxidizing endosymbiont of Gigantopelta aegis]|uniref:cupin domain-containing protein n=1 Tax=sulfur-oxidizing endosymbiont of Gigantopelta aegis TaxID=2794934 RepID=UPI0018DDFA89|nr:cupin domain-containing protein [sulfur-oxidizing endosymbiont of Gigantopelta aegis]
MNTYLTPYDPNKQFSTPERCTINELLNHAGDSQCSIARAAVAPGICTQLHALKNTIERYIILSGQGRVFINHEAPEEVSALDSISIPADVAQKIENTGQTELVFLCICTPRFEQKNYYTLEEE